MLTRMLREQCQYVSFQANQSVSEDRKGGGGRISISWPIRDVPPSLGSKFKKDPDFWFKFGVNSRLWVLFFRKASFQYHTWGKILIFGDQS